MSFSIRRALFHTAWQVIVDKLAAFDDENEEAEAEEPVAADSAVITRCSESVYAAHC